MDIFQKYVLDMKAHQEAGLYLPKGVTFEQRLDKLQQVLAAAKRCKSAPQYFEDAKKKFTKFVEDFTTYHSSESESENEEETQEPCVLTAERKAG